MTMKRVLIGGQLVRIDDTTGHVGVVLEDATQVMRAPISASSAAAGGNVLVAAVTGKSIQVLGIMLIAAGDVVATFYSGPADTGSAISGAMTIKEGAGFVCPPPTPSTNAWLATVAGEPLTLLLGGAVQVSGFLNYVEV